MAADDVELVRRWFDGLRRGDVSPDLCNADIEIRNWRESPNPGPYHGHDGVRRWWQDTQDAFEDVRFELVDVLDLGEGRVLTTQRIVGRFRLTGIDLDHHWGSIVSVREGKIASAVGYVSVGSARRAAGLADEPGD